MKTKFKLKWEKLIPKSPNKNDRSLYEKDYDRIIFAQCFRRLAGKTQVHPFAHSDHIHTRLSHSLEVSIVGRSIIKEIFKKHIINDEYKQDCINIIMAVGLAHDMGNPPFGHIGEDSISSWIRENKKTLLKHQFSEDFIDSYSSYDGNAQNFHLFCSTEYFDKKQLSPATLASLVKYPWISQKDKPKSGFFPNEHNIFKKCFKKLGLEIDSRYARHPLSYILEAADDICYSIMDVDDAYEMGINGDTKKINKHIKNVFGKTAKNTLGQIRENRGEFIEKAVKAVAKAFSDNIQYIMNGNVATKDYSPLKKDLIIMGGSDSTLQLVAELKKFAQQNIFSQRDKVVAETACYNIISTILDAWLKSFSAYHEAEYNYEQMPTQAKKFFSLINIGKGIKKGDEGLIQIIDYVSGMTDRYAKFIADTISGRI